MDFAVLGPLEVHTPAGARSVTGHRQRALLAALLTRTGHTVAVADLIDSMWPQQPPRTAEHTLHTHISRLRTTLGIPVVARDGGYLLDIPPAATDAGRFDTLMAEATLAPAVDAVPLLEQALALWRGPAYGSSADLPAVRPEARRLEEQRLRAQEQLVRSLGDAGRPAEAVALGESLVGRAPARETAWVALIHALIAAGRPADGADAYLRATQALDELGLLPSVELRAAHGAALSAPDARTPHASPHELAPTAATPGAPPHPSVPRNPGRVGTAIPVLASSLIGRAADLDAIRDCIQEGRLVTLVGPGGVGKTRLALETLRRHANHHPSGTRIVELTTLTDPAAVAPAMVAAIGVAPEGGPAHHALQRAGELDLLVLLDNCEHVVDAVAESVEALQSGGRIRVLATSRERIGVPGECAFPVAPLPISGDAPPARALFLERAASAGLGSAVRDLDLETVDRVVTRLDGLPLAIEMAAALTSTFGLSELADMLESELGTELDLLRNPRRRGPQRHRTLRTVISWSEALLDETERTALHGWPVFVGPVEARDAHAVLGVHRQVLDNLVQRSLLLTVPDAASGITRYRMLHTVRSALLGDRPDGTVSDALLKRKARYFAEVATECGEALRGPDEPEVVARLTRVIAELRTAHAWALRDDPETAIRISRALHSHAVNTLDEELLGWGARLLGVDDDGPATTTGNVALAAQLTITGDLSAAAARADRALETAHDDLTRLQALEILTDTAIFDGRLSECRTHATRLAQLAARVGDAHYFAMAVGSLTLARAYRGDTDGARAELAELTAQHATLTASPSPTQLGWLSYAAGEIALDADPPAALESLDRAIELADRAGNVYLGGVARVSATSLRARHGEPSAALGAFAEIIGWWLERGDRPHLVTTLRNLLDVLLRLGADEPAAELWGSVGSDRGSRSFGAERARLDHALDTLSARLGAEALTGLLAVGKARDLTGAARAALATVVELAAAPAKDS